MVEKLSARIREAKIEHSRQYPDGNWKAVNDHLGALFLEAVPILLSNRIDPWKGGSEGRAAALERLGF